MLYIVDFPQKNNAKDVTDLWKEGYRKGDFEKLFSSANEYNPNNLEYKDLELVEPVKEFVPSQFFEGDAAYVTLPLSFKNNGKVETTLHVITSTREVLNLKDFAEKANYSITRHPNFELRWSRESVVEFLKDKASNMDFLKTFNVTVDTLKLYLDLGNDALYTVLALWIWGTYFHRLFFSFPYVNVNGFMKSGKSKLLEAGSFLAFNGEFLTASSPAFVISCINDNSGSVFLDEVENLREAKTPEAQTLIVLLNSGYKRGAKKGKMSSKGGNVWEAVKLDPYCPKMIAGIKGISDTLVSRSINITMLASTNNAIKNRELDEKNPLFKELRDSYYLSVMVLHPLVNEAYSKIEDRDLFGRDWEVWKPVLSMALVFDEIRGDEQPTIYDRVKAYAVESVRQASVTSADDLRYVRLLLALKQMMEEDQKEEGFYPVENVKEYLTKFHSDEFDWLKDSDTSRYVGPTLRKCGVINGGSESKRLSDGKLHRGYALKLVVIKERLKALGVDEDQ